MTADMQSAPAVATLLGTGFAVLWQSLNQDGDACGIFGRKFDQ